MKNLQKNKLVIILILSILSVGPYLRTLDAEFVWDDFSLVRQAAEIKANGNLTAIFIQDFRIREHLGYYRPIAMLSFIFNETLFGQAPTYYHLTNVILHCATTLLFFFLLRLWTGMGSMSFISAALFAVHPMNVESVAFISSRTDILAAFFMLWAAIFWLCSFRSHKQHIFLALSCLSWVLSLLSKETTILVPLLFISLHEADTLNFNNKFISFGRIKRLSVFSLAGYLVYAVLRFGLANAGFARLQEGKNSCGILEPAYLAAIFKKLFVYLKLMVFPVPSRSWYSESSVENIFNLAGVLLLFTIIGIVILYSKRSYLKIAVLWILLFITPVLGLVPIAGSIVAERFLYIPSMGFCLLAGGLLTSLSVKKAACVHAIAASIIILFSINTATRTEIWDNELTLCQDMTASAPDSYIPWGNLGSLEFRKGNFRDAVKSLERALSINPMLPKTVFRLGLAYSELRDWKKAIRYLEIAQHTPMESREEEYLLHRNLGMAYYYVNQYEKAVKTMARALSLKPNNEELLSLIRESKQKLDGESLN